MKNFLRVLLLFPYAVCKAGQLLQAVGVEPPVPGAVENLLHLEDGQAQLLAVGAAGPKLEHAEPGQRVDNVDHVGHHGRQDVDVGIVEEGDDLEFSQTKLSTCNNIR